MHRSLSHLLHESLHHLLHLETRSWHTLPLLIARPGLVTRRYIEGQRQRYLAPLPLFLFSVFLLFLVYSAGGGARLSASAAPRAQVAGDPIDQPLPGRPNIHTGWPQLDRRLSQQLANPELLRYKLRAAASKLAFVLIPISLPFLWLMFLGRPAVTMYDHAVFSLYSLSFMSMLFIATALLGAIGLARTAATLVVLVPPLHMFMQLRETYQLTVWPALWRTAALLCVAGGAFVLFLLLIVGMAIH